jgi:hypothetical protein
MESYMRDKCYIGSSLLFTATFLADDIAYVIKMVAQIRFHRQA